MYMECLIISIMIVYDGAFKLAMCGTLHQPRWSPSLHKDNIFTSNYWNKVCDFPGKKIERDKLLLIWGKWDRVKKSIKHKVFFIWYEWRKDKLICIVPQTGQV